MLSELLEIKRKSHAKKIVKTCNIHYLNFVSRVEFNITGFSVFIDGLYERVLQDP